MQKKSHGANVKLRIADSSETQALYKMRAQSFERSYKSSMPDDVLNALVWGCSPSDFALAVQSGQIIVADIWGELAGFVWLDATHGKELVVSPKHYRTGIARILLIEGVRILLERTTAEITIYVTQNSINWYKRLGFNFIESITVQHLQSGTRIPLEKMVLDRDDALLLTERGRA